MSNISDSSLANNTSITSVSNEAIQKWFEDDGLVYVEDSIIGQRVEDMQKRGFPIESAYGLNFCKQIVLDDKVLRTRLTDLRRYLYPQRVQHILGAVFSRSILGIYEVYRRNDQQPDIVYAFKTGLEPLNALCVELRSPNSKTIYFKGAQNLKIVGFKNPIGLLEMISAPLNRSPCKAFEIPMTQGGL